MDAYIYAHRTDRDCVIAVERAGVIEYAREVAIDGIASMVSTPPGERSPCKVAVYIVTNDQNVAIYDRCDAEGKAIPDDRR